MLGEYLKEHLDDAQDKLQKEERKLKECKEMEKIIQNEIRQIQESSDIDFEIFSPRAIDYSMKGKMNQLYENLQLLTENIEILEKNIEEYKSKEQTFSVMQKEWNEMVSRKEK